MERQTHYYSKVIRLTGQGGITVQFSMYNGKRFPNKSNPNLPLPHILHIILNANTHLIIAFLQMLAHDPSGLGLIVQRLQQRLHAASSRVNRGHATIRRRAAAT